jgi:diaminobutyrate-2-oxoglutarate transaminase
MGKETDVFERLESEVRGYCRAFPTVFQKARGATLRDEKGREYTDFFAGAGSLNYGHNNPLLKARVINYLMRDGLVHGLDMYSSAKRDFLNAFERFVLWPREMEYKLMFTGPTGTNAVEAALKLARKVTKRHNVIAFTNGFHGMTMGALSCTGNLAHRGGASFPLSGVTRVPFDGYMGPDVDTSEYLERLLTDPSSGCDHPAAIIVETVQGEGGVNVAGAEWLQKLERIAREQGAMLIIDDIQVGCGRTGPFFSFEDMGISPDIITLSKSLGAYGLPMALVLFRPELDQWSPGEHNGTFRGNNLAFVAAAEALRRYWNRQGLTPHVRNKGRLVRQRLDEIAAQHGERFSTRGRGLMQGMVCADPEDSSAIRKEAFERGLIIEASGPYDEVVKVMPPLTISKAQLESGLHILAESVNTVAQQREYKTEVSQ